MTNVINATEVFASKRDVLNDWFVEVVNDFSPVALPELSISTTLVREVTRACGGLINPEDLLLHIYQLIVAKFKYAMAALLMVEQEAPLIVFADYKPDDTAVTPPLIFGAVMERPVSEREVKKVVVTMDLHVFNGMVMKEPETEQLSKAQLDKAAALSFLSLGQVTTLIALMGHNVNVNRALEEEKKLSFTWYSNVTECFDGLNGVGAVIHGTSLRFETYDPSEKDGK